MFQYATICSGVEGCSLAIEAAPPTRGAWSPLFFSEIAPFPSAVLAHHWPNVPNLGNMSKICLKSPEIPRKSRENPAQPIENTESEIVQISARPALAEIQPERIVTNGTRDVSIHGELHLLAGGTPCQDFSVAGRRAGAALGSGTRSSLCWEYVRLVAQLRPRVILWENVPGCLSTHAGRDFAAFVAALVHIGYGVAWRVLDCQFTRVDQWPMAIPQRRRRLWLVGVADGDLQGAAEILFEPACVQGRSRPLRAQGTPAPAGDGGDPPVAGVYNFELTSNHPLISACRARDNLVYPALTGATQQLTNAEIETGGLILDPGHCKAQEVVGTMTGNHESRITETTNVVHRNARVRRLTPEECEALMGYPIGHTRVPYRGRPADQCPDGPRYEACGNGWAVNCARWIVLGIHRYLEQKCANTSENAQTMTKRQ